MEPTTAQVFPPQSNMTAVVSAAAATAALVPVVPTAEAHNHVNVVPPLTVNHHHHNQPTYPEMIFAAITALKEKNGSSKRAIAKYIERVYSELPSDHSNMLTNHLKRLKNSGILLMVKKSYKLPRSDFSSSPSPSPSLPLPLPLPLPPSTGPLLQAQPQPQPRSRGRPPKPKPKPNPNPNANAQPVLVALGLVDEPPQQVVVKRGPGRPSKKSGQDGPTLVNNNKGRVGRPPGPRLPKRSPGRPPKPKSVTSVSGLSGLKRGRGRPPKAAQLKTMIIPFATNSPSLPAVQVPVAAVPLPPNTPRSRGRPKKGTAPSLPVVAGGIFSGKRRGRKPKLSQPHEPKISSGRPVGRPKKNASSAVTAIHDQGAVAYGDLKRKLEYIQSKVKEAVGVLKPQITNESAAISAVAAIQELEGVAAMDIGAPLLIGSHPPQPQPQAQVQPQPQPLPQAQAQPQPLQN